MSFKRLETDDFVISADAISATVWSGGNPNLVAFFTSSTQEAGSSGNYYLNVYQTSSLLSDAEVQFAISYGNKHGSGSSFYNSAVTGSSPTRTIYGQYRTLVLADETQDFIFGGVSSSDFWALSIDRSRYKEKLFLGSLGLKISGSAGTLYLTDNSRTTNATSFNDAGRVYQLVSGSQGVVNTGVTSNGYSVSQGSYGLFLPDIGTIILNPLALSESIGLIPSQSFNGNGFNNRSLYRAINGGAGAASGSFKLNSEETISSNYIFIRAKSSEFNYTENPSYISGSTGEVLYDLFINNPQTYVTTIGLYNDVNDLLAVAKISRPLLKDFTKEALVRVKLDF